MTADAGRPIAVPDGYSLVSTVRLETVLSLARSGLGHLEQIIPPYEADQERHRQGVARARVALDGIYRTPEDDERRSEQLRLRQLVRAWEPVAEAMTVAYERGRGQS